MTCRDPDLWRRCLAAKEQMFICGARLDEELTARVLERRAARSCRRSGRRRRRSSRSCATGSTGHEHFEWVEPAAGVVGFPRLRPELDVDVDRFYRALCSSDHGTYVGPGHWFDQDRRYFRLGFAWPTEDELAAGSRASVGLRRWPELSRPHPPRCRIDEELRRHVGYGWVRNGFSGCGCRRFWPTSAARRTAAGTPLASPAYHAARIGAVIDNRTACP